MERVSHTTSVAQRSESRSLFQSFTCLFCSLNFCLFLGDPDVKVNVTISISLNLCPLINEGLCKKRLIYSSGREYMLGTISGSLRSRSMSLFYSSLIFCWLKSQTFMEGFEINLRRYAHEVQVVNVTTWNVHKLFFQRPIWEMWPLKVHNLGLVLT